MIGQQKTKNKTFRDKQKQFEKYTFDEMRNLGKQPDEADLNGTAASFYRSQMGRHSSIGMQGVLNSGNYGYVAKTRQMSNRQRLQSAGTGNRRGPGLSQR